MSAPTDTWRMTGRRIDAERDRAGGSGCPWRPGDDPRTCTCTRGNR
jgi:hypothetical protein